MEFLKLSQSISLFTSNDINESAVVSLTYPLGPVSFSPMDSLVRTTLSGKLKILNRVKFCTFLKAVMMDKEVVFWAIGIGSVLVKMPIGHVTISGMPVSEKLTLKGMEGFLSCQPQINGVVITDASNSNVLVVRISLQLENPSLISGNMGKLTMNVYFKETIKVGLACIEDFTLVPGKNVLDSASTLSFPSDEVKAEFFSQYMNGSSIGLSLNHFDSSVPMLLPTLLDYTMNLKMQGIKEDMVILCVLGPAATFLFAPKSRFVVYNPIDLPVTLLGLTDMVISINRQGEKTSDTYAELIGMAKVNIASLNAPFTIPPKSMAEIEEFIPLELSWDFNVLESASSRLLLTPNVLYIHMTGSMLIQIEPNYQISLNYQQNDIPVYFDHWRPPAPYQISKKSESVIFVDP